MKHSAWKRPDPLQWTRLSAHPFFRTFALPVVIAVLTLRSVFGSGYLIQIDTAFGPRAPAITFSFSTPVQLLMRLLYVTAGGAWAGRIQVLVSLALCGVGVMLLLRDHHWLTQCAGAVLAMLNPFVYDRLVEGQWGVVMATGGTFLFVAAWLRLRREPGPMPAVLLAASVLLTVTASANFAPILLFLTAALAVTSADWRSSAFLRWALTSLALGAALCSYGVVAFFVGRGYSSFQNVSHFTAADFIAFQSTPSPDFGLIPALIGLYGEWSERLGRYVVGDLRFSWWIASAIVLSALALTGAWLRPSRRWLLVLGIVAIAVSASTAVGPGQQVAITLARHVPLIAADREPQKWLVLWLVAFVWLVAIAVDAIGSNLGRRAPSGQRIARLMARFAGPLLAVLVIGAVFAPAGWVALRYTGDVVRPVDYPTAWYDAAAYLRRAVPPDVPVAVLPWHLYETMPFIGRKTVDPSVRFFPGTLVTSSDAELPGNPATDPIGVAVGKTSTCALASALQEEGVSRVIVIDGAPGGQANRDLLLACGFATIHDSQGMVQILARH